MNEPILVILAAGMGSRYGGLKQIDPVGLNNETILDYSLFDAQRAGFKKAIIIIKKAIEKEFKEIMAKKKFDSLTIEYAYQEIDKLPISVENLSLRSKPWGTTHAVWCCKDLIDAPFVVINADDFYGASAFKSMYEFLTQNPNSISMVGYELGKTTSKFGSVARGVCEVNENHYLQSIDEITDIVDTEKGIKSDNRVFDPKTIVSMNFWGFPKDYALTIESYLVNFLENLTSQTFEKAECYLPKSVQHLMETKGVQVKVLSTDAQWFGVTYQEDKPFVKEKIQLLTEKGVYPNRLYVSDYE